MCFTCSEQIKHCCCCCSIVVVVVADTGSISSGTVKERKISLKKKNKAVSPLGVENGLINL